MWLGILFIIIGIFSRVIPHVPNFSPLAAVALFSGLYINKKHGYLIPLAIYIISDAILGFHNTVVFTWLSIAIIYFLGVRLRQRKTAVNTIVYTLFSSILFFVITNFGVWAMGWYPPTVDGLIRCYVLAVPFFRMSLVANFAYVFVFFSSYEYFLSRYKPARETV
ncbi:MAG: DUF6580 family putative transport protein [Candidatus Omnitrophota bacterium]|jgi:hypothetical protein